MRSSIKFGFNHNVALMYSRQFFIIKISRLDGPLLPLFLTSLILDLHICLHFPFGFQLSITMWFPNLLGVSQCTHTNPSNANNKFYFHIFFSFFHVVNHVYLRLSSRYLW